MSLRTAALTLAIVATALGANIRAQDYTVDAAHSSAVFRVSHLGLSWTYGRFKQLSGAFAVGQTAQPQFELVAQAGSIDTDNAQRDEHLKSPDFFNVKQYPTITFRSTSVKPIEGGYEVAGDLTLHGVTKPVALKLAGGGQKEFPKGVKRTGFVGEFTIKRSDFGMDKMIEAIGDDVRIEFSFEGTQK